MLEFLAIALIGVVALVGSLVFDFDHPGDDGGHSFVSLQSLALFVTTFGAVGAIAMAYGGSVTYGIVLGSVGGFMAAAAGLRLMGFFKGQESDSTFRAAHVLDHDALVTNAIPPGGIGQVMIVDGTGRTQYRRAMSAESVSEGSVVTVTGVVGDAVMVARRP